RLFDIERYNTLFQMTSTVEGRLKKGITYFDIFKSLFPGGSVTGAPKLRTMQIIKELEVGPRNVYCGALGIIFPRKKAIFNLPIRTILIDKNKAEMGVGGGIVIDSDIDKEYEECLLKARFLTERYQPFKLIESILWDDRYHFLDQHLKRMRDSAQYFDFKFNFLKIIKALKDLQRSFIQTHKYKVRLLLDKEGNLEIDYLDITYDFLNKENYVTISKERVDPENVFLYHKTTNRFLYDREYDYYRKKGYFEVIFLNKYGQVTEGAISNVVIKKRNNYYTPLIYSGLLPGIFRQYLVKNYNVKERVIYLKDLINADKLFVCNSVRGIIEVKLKNDDE
ncbi:MAG: aminotransferase class IV, partial [Candidatus Omnitrophica bacterium]|nr:aminotransferase class IV [Candidatus Omnitrophota bacterium]